MPRDDIWLARRGGRWDGCEVCRGTGRVQGRTDSIGMVPCGSCHGTGSTTESTEIERFEQRAEWTRIILTIAVAAGVVMGLLGFIAWLVHRYLWS